MASMELLAKMGHEPAVAYLRLSKEDREADSGIATQRDHIGRLVAAQGINLVGEFEDNGEDSEWGLTQRPEANALCEFVRAGRARWVIVLRYDRLGRDSAMMDSIDSLKRLGARCLSVTEDLNPYTRTGRAFAHIQAGMSGLERRTLQERVADELDSRARVGQWNTGAPGYGFRRDPDVKCLVPDERPIPGCPGWTEAGVVRAIYERSGGWGWGGPRIARWLNLQGVPLRCVYDPAAGKRAATQHPGGPRKWDGPRVNQLLHHPRYRGESTYGVARRDVHRERGLGEVVQEHAALVTRAVWDAAQATIAGRVTSTRGAGRDWVLAGLLVCQCGERMYGTGQVRGGSVREVYRCGGPAKARRRGEPVTCTGRDVKATDAESALWADIEAWVRNPAIMAARHAAAAERAPALLAEARVELATLGLRREKLRAAKGRLALAWSAGDLDDDVYREASRQREEEERPLVARVEALLGLVAGLEAEAGQLATLEALRVRLLARLDAGVAADERREVLGLVVEVVRCHTVPGAARGADHQLEVTYRFGGLAQEAAGAVAGVATGDVGGNPIAAPRRAYPFTTITAALPLPHAA